MRKFFQTKKMMSFVCVLFTAILSLCSINMINYHDLLTTSSQEEVYTSNENDNNTINNEENNSQNANNETNNNGTTENTDNTTNTSEEDDLDDVATATTNISTESQLRDMTYSGSYTLTANIQLTNEWTPISFGGTFNGNGHTISGIDITSGATGSVGFFSILSGATVENTIFNGSISVSDSSGANQVGGIAGICSDSTIERCWNKMDVTFDVAGEGDSCGGIVGTISDSTISECLNTGDITLGGDGYVGGIVGVAGSNNFTISNCHNEGNVECTASSGMAVGGIMGYAEITTTDAKAYITNCINSATMIEGKNAKVGGIVGGYGEYTKWWIFGANDPTGYITGCISSGGVSNSNSDAKGYIGGVVDTNIENCFTLGSSHFFGNSNDSNINVCEQIYNMNDALSRAGFDYGSNISSDTWYNNDINNVDSIYINKVHPPALSYFLVSVNIRVQVETEDGDYEVIDNKDYKYDVVGYDTSLRKLDKDTYGEIYILLKGFHYDLFYSISHARKDIYDYVGIFGPNDTLITDEQEYRDVYTYDMPSVVYVRFDLAGEDEPEPMPEPEPEPELPINFRVYYTERIGFNGNLPSDLHLDSTGMGGSVVTEIGGVRQTSNSGYIGYSKVKYQAEISLIAYPEDEYELCGVYAGDVGENPNECVNLAEFMNNATYLMSVNFSLDMSFDYVEYSFYNEIYDDDGNLVTNYSIVFSKYQYSGISFTQTFETNRFDEPYEYEMTTDFVYGYLNRSLGGFRLFSNLNLSRGNTEPRFYPVDEDGNISDIYETNYQLDFRDQDLNFNFFDGDGSHYVGELLTPTYGITNPTSISKLGFYWLWGANDTQEENTFYFRRYTGDTQFSNNRTIIEGRGLTAVPANKANNYPPYFTINLYNYFIIGNAFDDYGNINPSSAYLSGPGFNYIDFRVLDGNSAFKAGSVSFKEYSDPSQQQNFNLYFLNTYEDMGSNDLLFGDNGGKFEVSSLGGFDVQKTSFKVEDGVVYPVDAENGEEVEGYSVLNIGLRFTYQFVFQNRDPFESYYDTESDDVILNEEDKQLIMETPITELFRFTKSPNYLYYDYFGDRNTLIWDLPTYSSIDLSDFTIYDLALKMLEDDEENATYQNMENGNILLYNYFEVNRFKIVVMLDDEYSFDIDSVLSFYVNDMKYPHSSAEQYAIGNIKAYSKIELEIEDSVIYDSRPGRYTVYAYNNITSGGVQMTNQDSWHFQVIPEINSQNLVFTVNLDEVFSMTSSDFSSSSIQQVGNMWYIDEARDFYYLYYLNAFAGEDFEGIRLIQTANIDFGGASIMPLGTSSTPFRGVYDGQYYTIQNFEINLAEIVTA